jgi:cytidylate kinase
MSDIRQQIVSWPCRRPEVVTVDGATGSGKTGLLIALATRYRCPALEIGPVVRTVSWIATHRGVPVSSAVAILAAQHAAGRLDIGAPGQATTAASDIVLDGAGVSEEIFRASRPQAIAVAAVEPAALAWIFSVVRTRAGQGRTIVAGRQAAAAFPEAGLHVRLMASESTRRKRKQALAVRAGRIFRWGDDVALVRGRPSSTEVCIDTTDLSPSMVVRIVSREIETVLGWRPATAACVHGETETCRLASDVVDARRVVHLGPSLAVASRAGACGATRRTAAVSAF